MVKKSSAIVPMGDAHLAIDSNNNGIDDRYEGVIDAKYRVISQGKSKTYPIYQLDPTKPFSTFMTMRSILSAIRHRGPIALAELAVLGYIVLAGTAFGLNMLTTRPVRFSNVPIFDPTATGANIAWFFRPVVGVAADSTLDAQMDMFGTEGAEANRQRGLDRGRYAVTWED